MISEADLRLVHALQESPRAPWSVIAAVVGADARTVARRYEQLVQDGVLRVMATPGRRMLGRVTSAVLRARTRPGEADAAARQLAWCRHATTIRVTDGASDIYAVLLGDDRQSVWRSVERTVQRIPEIVDLQIHAVLESVDLGRAQRLDSLTDAQVAGLQTWQARRSRDHEREPVRLSPSDLELINVLLRDGRLEVSALAGLVGRGASSISRRLARLEADGFLDYVAMTTDRFSSRPTTALIRCGVDPPELRTFTRSVADMPWLGLLTVTTGSANVFLVARLESAADLGAVLLALRERCVSLHVHETQLSLQPVKLHTRLVDEQGAWTDEVIPAFAAGSPLFAERTS